LLAPRPGESILDIGCGDGALTERIAALGADVVGVDSSPSLVAAARARGLVVELCDAQELAYEGEFDAVFSNAALHWMRDPDAVIAGVHRALVPGGRFVAEFGGHGNVAAIRVALAASLARRGIEAASLEPWYFPTAADYRARLERGGFNVESLELRPRPTPLPADMDAWLDLFGGVFFAALPDDDERRAVRAETVALLAPVLRDDEDRWSADYVRLRVRARRE
jgi:SAM-dependent methyltransferase